MWKTLITGSVVTGDLMMENTDHRISSDGGFDDEITKSA